MPRAAQPELPFGQPQAATSDPTTGQDLWTVKQLRDFAFHREARIRAWALERVAVLHPDLAGPLAHAALHDRDEDVVDRAEEVLDFLAGDVEGAHPPGPLPPDRCARLHKLAPKHLGGLNRELSLDLLSDLERCRGRWAGELLLEAFERLLGTELDEDAVDTAKNLGDPRLLPLLLDAWSPGEHHIAEAATLLALLSGAEEPRLASLRDDVRPSARRSLDGPLRLRLRCTECRRAYNYEVAKVWVRSEALRQGATSEPGPDMYVLGQLLRCRRCDAEDRLVPTVRASLGLMARLVAGLDDDTPPLESTALVSVADLRLWDGTPMLSASQGIAHLRRQVDEEPDDGARWRRLGNLLRRLGNPDEAERCWECALADESEYEAAHSLMDIAQESGDVVAAVERGMMTLERMSTHDAPSGHALAIAEGACGTLRDAFADDPGTLGIMATWRGRAKGDSAVVHASMVDASSLRPAHWTALASLVASGHFVGLRFASVDVPDPSAPSQLFDLLSLPPRRPVRSQQRVARATTKPSRNGPCPCGSGRKYKGCCLRRR